MPDEARPRPAYGPPERRTWPGKGKSGEPRLTKADIIEMCEGVLPSLIERVQQLALDPATPTWAVLQALDLLTNRVYGKPAQEITGAGGGPIQISVDALRAKLEALATEVPSEIGPPRAVLALAEPVRDADLVERHVEPAGNVAAPSGGGATDPGATRPAE